jgi:hypothetical protein
MSNRSNSEQSKTVVDAYYQAGVEGRLREFARYLHPDFTTTAPNYLPWGGAGVIFLSLMRASAAASFVRTRRGFCELDEPRITRLAAHGRAHVHAEYLSVRCRLVNLRKRTAHRHVGDSSCKRAATPAQKAAMALYRA